MQNHSTEHFCNIHGCGWRFPCKHVRDNPEKSRHHVYTLCSDLRSIEGNFHSLKRLQKLEFVGSKGVEKLPEDLFDVECCLEELRLRGGFEFPHFPRFLRRLDLGWGKLGDGDIPYDIGELSNLQELCLSGNNFSRLHSSLLQLARLKLLYLTSCERLVELPKLPSSIAILKANWCNSLKTVGDFQTNCNWLCHVSLWKTWKYSLTGGISKSPLGGVSGGERVLRSMLQGNAIENHSLSLQIHGLEIPKGFIPPLVKGTTCILQLPQNWYNDFSGFLMCAVLTMSYSRSLKITMRHAMGGSMGMDSQRGLWEECVGDELTWVGYVSFGSLRHTTWWDSTYNAVSFSFHCPKCYANQRGDSCSGFGVGLVPRKNESDPMETTKATTDYSEVCDEKYDYTHKFRIEHDSKSALEISRVILPLHDK